MKEENQNKKKYKYFLTIKYSNKINFLIFLFLTIFIITLATNSTSHIIYNISGSLGILCGVRIYI